MVQIPTETPENAAENPQLTSRRGFMATASIAIGALFGLQFVYVLFRYLAPWGKFRVARPVRLVTDQQPKEGECVKVKYGDSVVLVIRDEGEFKAFNGACTHLNCLVRWQPATKKFFCACHNGFFDRNGKNIAGPPPSPLLAVDVARDGEDLIIGS
ncbi:MAG: Rieske (2Fe-2S) protein [Phycisphaerae bacterium]|nr:Rieske (2Fe-2S) protein [Phycisphaerae bacterium]